MVSSNSRLRLIKTLCLFGSRLTSTLSGGVLMLTTATRCRSDGNAFFRIFSIGLSVTSGINLMNFDQIVIGKPFDKLPYCYNYKCRFYGLQFEKKIWQKLLEMITWSLLYNRLHYNALGHWGSDKALDFTWSFVDEAEETFVWRSTSGLDGKRIVFRHEHLHHCFARIPIVCKKSF